MRDGRSLDGEESSMSEPEKENVKDIVLFVLFECDLGQA